MSQIEIRPTHADDADAIGELLGAAFAPSAYESRLRVLTVQREAPYHEWVLERDGGVVAYILYTQATDEKGLPIGYHLAPVAVHPKHQRSGFGSRLISESLASPALSGESVFMLGDPAFYERFGFAPTSSARCPFDEGNAHFRALRWRDRETAFPVGYAEAFFEA